MHALVEKGERFARACAPTGSAQQRFLPCNVLQCKLSLFEMSACPSRWPGDALPARQ